MALFTRGNLLIVAIALAGAGGGFLAGGWLRPLPPEIPGLTGLKVGDTATAFELPDPQGQLHTLAEWDGKLVLVNFWASWCGPCREEMPLLDAAQTRHAARGLQVLGVAADEHAAAVQFLHDFPVAYPILINAPGDDRDLSIDYGNTRSVLPFNVLIGRDGRIVAQRVGNFDAAGLEAWLAPHL